MKITITGTGYVGLSNAMLLSQNHEVIALDVNPRVVDLLNKKISPILDDSIQDFLDNANLNLVATLEAAAKHLSQSHTPSPCLHSPILEKELHYKSSPLSKRAPVTPNTPLKKINALSFNEK